MANHLTPTDLARLARQRSTAMPWKPIDFKDVARLLQGREIVEERRAPDQQRRSSTTEGTEFVLDDGTRIAGYSVRCGPYSSTTPDPDDEPPAWFVWIEEPKRG